MHDLKCDFDWYLHHQTELLAQFNGRVLVIRDQQVVGNYNSEAEAIMDARGKFEPGTFLVQVCVPGESAYSQSFSSRVIL